jgi:outer membrane lipase/esterase
MSFLRLRLMTEDHFFKPEEEKMKTKLLAGKKSILTGLLAITLLTPNGAFAEIDFNKIVVFGTSLLDPGNIFAETHEVNVPPGYDLDENLIPNSAYAIGGHHLTNGPTWIEQLGKKLKMKSSVLPATRDENPNAMNYAADGSRAVLLFHGPGEKKTFREQFEQFMDDVGGSAPSDALYIIEIGSNDVRDALQVFADTFASEFLQGLLDGLTPEQAAAAAEPVAFGDAIVAMSDALTEIGAVVGDLLAAGAQKFLFVNVGPLGFTPAIRAADDGSGSTIDLANFLADFFNANLFGAIINPLGPNANELDLFTLTFGIVLNPQAFGFKNVTEACITPYEAPFKCRKPRKYLFWDRVHPTKAGHHFIAVEAATVLGIN